MNRICNTCNIKKDKNNYLKNRTVCERFYNKNRKKSNINILKQKQISTSHQQAKIKKINKRTLISVFSNCGKTFLMNHFLHQKHEPFFVNTKSLNRCPNIKSQTSDEYQPLEKYGNSTVVVDDMLLWKQKSNIDLFLTRGRHNNFNID